MPTSRSLTVLPRFFRSEVERVLRAVIRRLPPRVQRLSMSTLDSLTERWPLLSRLLRIPEAESATNGHAAKARSVDVVVEGEEPTQNGVVPAATRPEKTVSELIAALRDPSAEVAVSAAEELRAHPSDATIAALSNAIDNPDGYFSPTTRAAAIRTLGALLPIGRGAPIAAAVGAMDAEVSLAAIATLVERDDPCCADALLEVLENPRGFYLSLTRRAAARGLLSLEITHDARLQSIFDTESDEDVRESLVPLGPWITHG
jgi:hypothetical protein